MAESTSQKSQLAFVAVGYALVAFGVVAMFTGTIWGDQAEAYLTGYKLTKQLELYFPYYPFVPFLPMPVILLGAFLVAKARR